MSEDKNTWAREEESSSAESAASVAAQPDCSAAQNSTGKGGPGYDVGSVLWHSSEEDGGPDVGIQVGLGRGFSLYCGEIPTDTLEDHGVDLDVYPDGWWVVLYGPDEQWIMGAVPDHYRAQEAVEHLSALVRPTSSEAPPSSPAEGRAGTLPPDDQKEASRDLREQIAQLVYERAMERHDGPKPAWVPGGNSRKQDEARRIADAILSLSALSALTDKVKRLEEALREAERFMEYYADETRIFVGPGTPKTCLAQIRAALSESPLPDTERAG